MGRSCLIPGSRVVDLRCDLNRADASDQEHEDMCRFVVLSPYEKESWKCFDRLRTRVRPASSTRPVWTLQEGFPEVSTRMVLSLRPLADCGEGAARRS